MEIEQSSPIEEREPSQVHCIVFAQQIEIEVGIYQRVTVDKKEQSSEKKQERRRTFLCHSS